MSALSFNFVPSLVSSSINEKVTNFLTTQQKKVAIIALAALSILALAIYFFRNSFFKGSVKPVEAPDLKLAQSKLEEGINISDDTLSKLKDLMPKIRNMEKDDAIEWLSTKNNLVFKIAGSSNLVFKMSKDDAETTIYLNDKRLKGTELMDERFATMVKGKAVCLTHQLGLLIIPHAKKIKIDDQTLIAEESLDIDAEDGIQEEFYHKYSTELNETVRQLAIFIAKTGFNDVIWRNIPLLNEAESFHGDRRVGLIDIEHMEKAVEGFVGSSNRSCGLIRCVSEKQIDLVIAEARKQGVTITDEQIGKVKNLRLKEIESDNKLRELHEKNHIINGKEPIQVDVDSLGLDLTEESVYEDEDEGAIQTFRLRKVAEDVIDEINKYIQKASDHASTKGKRSIQLSTSRRPIRFYKYLGASNKDFLSEESRKNQWLPRIFQALIDKGHLFSFCEEGNGYLLQA